MQYWVRITCQALQSLTVLQKLPSVICFILLTCIAKHCVSQVPARISIDQEKIRAHGIRVISGKHIDIYTDLPVAQDVDELAGVFDQAIPQWCAYFDVAATRVKDWKINGFLIKERKKFADAGLLHKDLPPFLNGYQTGHQFWVLEQPSPFYRRHLFLHEGTHAFMNLILGGAGPPWYLEGMAELQACHQWKDGKLKINHRIADRESSPGWGRVKVIKDAVAANAVPTLEQIFRVNNKAFLRVDPYAWTWALNAFFDGHPEYQKEFRKLRENVTDSTEQFTDSFLTKLKNEMPHIREQWQLYINEIDYGYDVARAAVKYRKTNKLGTDSQQIELAVDCGWQSSGIQCKEGDSIQIEATGRYQVAHKLKPWLCEPNGITIHYYRGKPLGALVYAISNNGISRTEQTGLLKEELVGKKIRIKAPVSGTLFFRINESPNGLSDNKGKLNLEVKRQP